MAYSNDDTAGHIARQGVDFEREAQPIRCLDDEPAETPDYFGRHRSSGGWGEARSDGDPFYISKHYSEGVVCISQAIQLGSGDGRWVKFRVAF